MGGSVMAELAGAHAGAESRLMTSLLNTRTVGFYPARIMSAHVHLMTAIR